MTTKARNWLIAIFILACPFVLFLGFLVFMGTKPLPPPAPMPNPNGYDTLVNAGKAVTDNVGDFDQMSAAQLRELVGKNAAALAQARAGLSNQCRVPIQYSESYISNHLADLAGFKRLAQAFAAEGMWAETNGRASDAAQSFLDAIRLGDKSMRGGILIDELVGIAIEAIGTSHLQTLVPRLNADTCGEIAATLETLDSHGQTWSELKQQENTWSHATFRGWRYELARWESRKSLASARAAGQRKFNAGEQRLRRLMIDLAARAYELDKGHPPTNVADLVPVYLKAVPQDPVTGANMVYPP
jgi:hypothetical protein